MSTQGVLAGKGYVRIGLDDGPLFAGIRQMQSRMRSVGDSIRSAGAGMFSVGATGITALIPAILMASDAAEGYNRFQAVMGEEATKTDAALGEMGKRIGRVKSELRDTSSSFQGMLVGLGMSKSEAAKLSTTLTELSLDFASFNNLSDADASERFLAGLSGSGEVFDRFGINIKEGMLKLQLAKMGITGTATELEKAQARIAIIQDSMARQGATGDATTTANSFANQLKAIGAEAKQAAQDIGATLLPEISKYTPELRRMLGETGKWLAANPKLIIQFAKLAAGAVAGGVALMAIGQGLRTSAGAMDLAIGGMKLLNRVIDPKPLVNWSEVAGNATKAFKFFAAGLAITAIVLLTAELAGARDVMKELNEETDRNHRLNKRWSDVHAGRKNDQKEPVTEAEVSAAMQQTDSEAESIKRNIVRKKAEIDRIIDEVGVFGTDPLGAASAARADVELWTAQLEEATAKATALRKRLVEMQATKSAISETSKQSGVPAAELLARAQQATDLARKSAAVGAKVQVPAADAYGAGLAAQQKQFRDIRESITGTFSGTALAGQWARQTLAKKAEDAALATATHTKATADAVADLSRKMSFG